MASPPTKSPNPVPGVPINGLPTLGVRGSRLILNEDQFFLLLAIIIGLIPGLLVVFFQLSA